jgi:hypothetical protein
VERPSQAVGCTNCFKKISVYLFSEFSYEFMVVHFTLCMRMVLCVVVDDLLEE